MYYMLGTTHHLSVRGGGAKIRRDSTEFLCG